MALFPMNTQTQQAETHPFEGSPGNKTPKTSMAMTTTAWAVAATKAVKDVHPAIISAATTACVATVAMGP